MFVVVVFVVVLMESVSLVVEEKFNVILNRNGGLE